MPPAQPASKRGSKQKAPERKPKGRCHTCGRAIRVPEGWSLPAAVRRHYWSKHREVMQPERKDQP